MTSARCLAMIALASALSAQTPPPTATAIGPVLSLNGLDATVVWNSNSLAVKYGTYGRLESQANASSMNRVTLNNLRPGVLYRYDIPSIGSGSFVMPPSRDVSPGVARYSFAIVGDTRGDNETSRAVLAAIT